jgi:hypothetical protein
MGILILIAHKGDLQACVWAEVVNKKAESRDRLIKLGPIITGGLDHIRHGASFLEILLHGSKA